jgi:hypothetical protein
MTLHIQAKGREQRGGRAEKGYDSASVVIRKVDALADLASVYREKERPFGSSCVVSRARWLDVKQWPKGSVVPFATEV